MKNVFVLCMALIVSLQLMAQQRRISGTILDGKDRSAMIGANIIEKGTSNGTVTDVDGKFSMVVSSNNSVLVISSIGYRTIEVNVGNQTTFTSIVMEEDVELLDEVVVVAYGSQKKVTVTGSVSNVSGTEILKSPTVSLGNALAGKLPGVSTVQYSGLPVPMIP